MTPLDIALEALREIGGTCGMADEMSRIAIARVEAAQKAPTFDDLVARVGEPTATVRAGAESLSAAHRAGWNQHIDTVRKTAEEPGCELLGKLTQCHSADEVRVVIEEFRCEAWEAGVRDGWNASRECEYDTTSEAPSLEELIARGPK